MSHLKIAMYQFNSIVGDIQGNTNKLIKAIELAKLNGADLFIAPELAICGYPPEDLLFRKAFYVECQQWLNKLLDIDGITMLIGAPNQINNELYNCIYAMRDGNILGKYSKMVLPNYGVFDECRYFTPGAAPLVIECNGLNIGIIICEDMWDIEPIAECVDVGADLVCIANASPFELGKLAKRHEVATYRVEETATPIVYVNQVGGQDELIFDGASFVMNSDLRIVAQLPMFIESLTLVQYDITSRCFTTDIKSLDLNNHAPSFLYDTNIYDQHKLVSDEEIVYKALVLALQDYVAKNNFENVLISFSGGIDSALCLAIAVDALGSDKVRSIMLPSPYTAEISLLDARAMTKNLGVKHDEIDIMPLMEAFMLSLCDVFCNEAQDVTEENLQARIRGNIVMALSNKFGLLVITTGNKSEMTTGYATLYGDMAGGFALLKDVDKTLVYKLAKWRNSLNSEVIPLRIITRAPSAELCDNQLDQDSLPEYSVLDNIVSLLVEHNLSSAEIISQGFMVSDVEKVAKLLKINEYKRRQSAVGPKITSRAYSKDWRYPISHKFKF